MIDPKGKFQENYFLQMKNTLSKWFGSAPFRSKIVANSKWPPAHANERTVASFVVVDRLTFAPWKKQ